MSSWVKSETFNLRVSQLETELQAEKAKVQRLREALEFYADGGHIGNECSDGSGDLWIEGGEDGAKARKALNETTP